jgi:hypothetical protein
MIATKRVENITAGYEVPNFTSIKVMSWHKKDTEYYTLSPYHLKTDGQERQHNYGQVIFENFWQGSKVYSKITAQEIYCHKNYQGNPKYLWWKYEPTLDSHVTVDKFGNTNVNDEYFKWKASLWTCKHGIRFPNGFHGRKNVLFTLFFDKDHNDTRMDYITARKEIYVAEYCRLIRKLPEYKKLLEKAINKENLLILEMDVPSKSKKEPWNNVDKDGICVHTLESLNVLLNSPVEPFGHGLCICLALLEDLRDLKNDEDSKNAKDSKNPEELKSKGYGVECYVPVDWLRTKNDDN